MALAGTMEASKLVTAGAWLGRHWRSTGGALRAVLVALVAGLALINAAGVYGRLVEAHLGVTVAASSSIQEQLGALDAQLDAKTQVVRVGPTPWGDRRGDWQADRASRAGAALEATANQRKTREALLQDRLEAAVLVDLRSDRAKLEAERQRAAAANGPVVYMAVLIGVPADLAIRWLILLMVLTCNPTAIALTVAASRRGGVSNAAR